ncbi:MAG: hypothetical protein IKM34_05645 [Clostridia bacterium]|nr:hypothetical protein [Clostridia bacterium]
MKKHQDQQRIKAKRRLILYAYMLLILLILTTVSAYASFSLSTTPRVSNLSIYINTVPGMEITLDPEDKEWGQHISYEDMFPEKYKLRPATWSQKDMKFYGARYSYDGKLKDQWEPLTDARHANNTSYENYYCIATFYAHSVRNIQVSLAPAVALDNGLSASGTYLMGEPVWNAETILHDNNGKGAENAIRIGLRVTRLDESLEPTGDAPEFIIYEPNADAHNDGSIGYLDTPSIDGSETLIEKDKIITQSASTWTETDPVERDVQKHQLGEFTDSSDLFTMKKDEVVKIEMIIWLEGQDADCTNAIADAGIVANLQFKVTELGGGLQPIPQGSDNP